MAIEDVGVRFVTEGYTQFKTAMSSADKAVDNFGKSATKAADNLKSKWSSLMGTLSSPEGMKFMMGAATAAAGALVAVGAGIKKLADEYMNYAFQVKDFGRIIGATPEEASKLIQVADDVRLSVGSMTVAMRTAITKGYRPTVEGLGQMSDAYLSIQDPLQRSKFLIETFGRSGLEMAKLMELGSNKIKEMGDSIEGTGRLMTTEGIAKAQAYYEALDRLQDSIKGVTLTLGGEFAPVITDTANGLSQFVDDGIGVIDMFVAFQEAAQAGAANLYDLQYALVDYMLINKTAAQVTADFKQRTLDANNANITFTNSLIESRRALQYSATTTADATMDLADATIYGGEAAWQASDAYKSMAAGIEKAQAVADSIHAVEIGLEFKAPDIASQMQNLMKSIDWKAAGGEALQTFMQGFAAQAAPLTDAQKKQVAAQIGAVDVALKVDTGDMSKWEGIAKIKELFKEIGGINTTDAQALIDKISGMSPPDITAYLNSIMQLAAPETTAAAATNTAALNTSVSNLGMSFSTNQAGAANWAAEMMTVGANTKTAKDETGFLEEKVTAAGVAAQLEIPFITSWRSEIEILGTKSHESANFTEDLNQQLKSIPKSITVDIYVRTHGSIPTARTYYGPGGQTGQAAGGPVYGNTLYLVGEKGPELFVPDVSGTIIPNGRTNSILNSLITIVPMAKGGKMTSAQEKAHNRMVMQRKLSAKNQGGGEDVEGDSTASTILGQGNDVLEALKARETIAWDLVRTGVAEYNQLIKSGVSPSELIDRRRVIDQQTQEAQALTKLRIESERQVNLLKSQADTSEGLEDTSTWLGKLISQFKDFFALLTSAAAQDALRNLNPLTSSSPAPLAVGLAQIGREMSSMSVTSIPRFAESIAQLANPGRVYNSQSSIYNINVPVTATVNNGADISRIAYAVAKEIAANVRP